MVAVKLGRSNSLRRYMNHLIWKTQKAQKRKEKGYLFYWFFCCKDLMLRNGVRTTNFFTKKSTLFTIDHESLFTKLFKMSVFCEKVLKILEVLYSKGVMAGGTRLPYSFAIDHTMLWMPLGTIRDWFLTVLHGNFWDSPLCDDARLFALRIKFYQECKFFIKNLVFFHKPSTYGFRRKFRLFWKSDCGSFG